MNCIGTGGVIVPFIVESLLDKYGPKTTLLSLVRKFYSPSLQDNSRNLPKGCRILDPYNSHIPLRQVSITTRSNHCSKVYRYTICPLWAILGSLHRQFSPRSWNILAESLPSE